MELFVIVTYVLNSISKLSLNPGEYGLNKTHLIHAA